MRRSVETPLPFMAPKRIRSWTWEIPMNHRIFTCNLLLHLQQKVGAQVAGAAALDWFRGIHSRNWNANHLIGQSPLL